MSMNEDILLSIVISTYNRMELLNNNLKTMMQCKRKDIEFLVCDNHSTDGTWEMLLGMADKRLAIQKRETNLGISNSCLLPYQAHGAYFINVNDRDYIKPDDIDWICRLLASVEKCDFIALCGPKWNKRGYYGWKGALRFYFAGNHPGNVIFHTAFYCKHIDQGRIARYISRDEVALTNYINEQFWYHIQKVYYCHRTIIRQPANRDQLVQNRKELYGKAYILPEYHFEAFHNGMKICLMHKQDQRTKEVLREIYKNSLYKVTTEYRNAVSSDDFCRRNHCEGGKPSDWIANAFQFTGYVLGHPATKELSCRMSVIQEFIACMIVDMCRIGVKLFQNVKEVGS